jgi:Amt family ammonium transporter
MIAFFAQTAFSTASGYASLPNGLLFGGGMSAGHQLGIEAFGAVVVVAAVFVLSFIAIRLIAMGLGGITRSPESDATEGLPSD